MFLFKNRLAVNNHLVTFNGNYFTGIFIYKILNPCFQHTSRQFTSQHLLEVCFGNLYIFCQIKDFKDVPIVFKTDSSQQRSNGQFLFTIDVSIHHIINVCSKLNPRALEWNDTCRI